MKWLLWVSCFLLASLGHAATHNDPIPYPAQPDRTDERGPLPAQSDPTYVRPDDYPVDHDDAHQRLATLDEDPEIGLSAQFIAAAMFVEASRGSLVDARFGFGGRLTWDWGLLIPNDVLRHALFVDLQYLFMNAQDGTEEIFVNTRFHYLTAAPAYQFPFGENSPYSFFLQLGAGVAFLDAPLTVDGTLYPNGGLQFLFQYGLGFRGKPRIGGPDSSLRLHFRIDVTRFRRGYNDDTYVGGAIGLGF